jgi:hypothetical protein
VVECGRGAICGPGGPDARDAQGGRFGARDRKPSPLGSVSVGPGVQPLLIVAGCCRVRARGQMRAWGAWNARCARGGWFDARTQKLSPTGSISVGPRKRPQLTMAGGFRMRVRGQLWAWGAWNPRYAGGGRFGARNENRARAARYRWDLRKAPS